MAAVGYFIAIPFIYGIAWLPFPLLYLLSDGLFVVLYHMAGYRRKVVQDNLRRSFPEKSEAERRAIERAFYRWFCDLVLETVRTLTISRQAIIQRVAVDGEDILRKYHAAGRSVMLVMGHWGNWEWGGARFAQLGLHQLFVIYHPLQNKWFDRLVLHMRTRLGNRLYTMEETSRSMLRDREQLTATAFIADQTPAPERAFWTTFMGQDTPIFLGPERLARKLGYPIIYVGIRATARGHYTMRFEELVAEPSGTADGAITIAHTRRLEADIRQQPQHWLWTHRRWKHRRPTHPHE